MWALTIYVLGDHVRRSNDLLDFDIVLPTRNQQVVLSQSIPLMLSQSCLPRCFIVVDASDIHGKIRETAEGLFEGANTHVRVRFLRAEAGSS